MKQEAKWIALTTIAAASVPASYGVAVNDTQKKGYISIYSTLDQPVLISFDGSTDHLIVDKTQALTPILADGEFYVSGKIYVKYLSANPTTGSLYIAAAANLSVGY